MADDWDAVSDKKKKKLVEALSNLLKKFNDNCFALRIFLDAATKNIETNRKRSAEILEKLETTTADTAPAGADEMPAGGIGAEAEDTVTLELSTREHATLVHVMQEFVGAHEAHPQILNEMAR